MKELKKDVEQIVRKEFERICAKWGQKYVSVHEAYGIIVEEYDESKEKIEELEYLIRCLRLRLRRGYDTFIMPEIEEAALLGACELIQVAAVAVKAQRGFEK